jgi:hypothetical protein
MLRRRNSVSVAAPKTGVSSRQVLVATNQAVAAKLGFERMAGAMLGKMNLKPGRKINY